MLQLLQAREMGIDPPWLLPKVYSSQRFTEIELKGDKEFVRGHRKGINTLDIDKDTGRYLISGGADKSGTIVIHDVLKPPKCKKFECPIVTNASFQYVPCEERKAILLLNLPLYTSLYMCLYDSSGQYGSQDESHAISVVQWYPHDTGIFTTSSVDKLMKVWDTNAMRVVEKFKFSSAIYAHSIASAESHCLIAVGGKECRISLCDMESGSSTHVLRFHRQPVMSLAWSPRNDHLLASGSQDNKLVIWDIRKASGPLMDFDQHNGSGSSNVASVMTAHNGHVNGLCFSSDGLHLLSFGTDNRLRLWDTFTGKNTLINYGRLLNTLQKQTVQFTITSHTSTLHPLICLPSSGDIIMIEMLTGKIIRRLQGHFGQVNCLVSHPIEQEIYSGGSDTNILAWGPLPPRLKQPIASNFSSSASTSRSRAANIYQDTWSSDEDN